MEPKRPDYGQYLYVRLTGGIDWLEGVCTRAEPLQIKTDYGYWGAPNIAEWKPRTVPASNDCIRHKWQGLGPVCPYCADEEPTLPRAVSTLSILDAAPVIPRDAIPTPIAEKFMYNNVTMPDAMKLIRHLEQDRARLIGVVNALQGVSNAEFNELLAAGMPKTLIEHARSQCRTFEEFNSKFPLDKVLI